MTLTTARLILPKADLLNTAIPVTSGPVDTPKAAALAIALRSHLPLHCSHLLALNPSNRLIGYAPVAAPGLTAEWLRPILAISNYTVSSVIACWQEPGAPVYLHSHAEAAETLKTILRRCGITLADYLIVGDTSYISFKETGRL